MKEIQSMILEEFQIKVILIHGFNKQSKDMDTLKNYLTNVGYECISPDLPLTYGRLEEAVSLLENLMEDIFLSLEKDEKIYFVGHSTGGLVIRLFLEKTNHLTKIKRCVLIATPSHGSELAEIGMKIKPFSNLFKTIQSLSPSNTEYYPFAHTHDVEIAAIAGNKNNMLLGNLLKTENDGRVEVRSVYYPELTDFIVLPYGHKDIHHEKETAEYVEHFFKTGKLKEN